MRLELEDSEMIASTLRMHSIIDSSALDTHVYQRGRILHLNKRCGLRD
jgi:hypothetical protein